MICLQEQTWVGRGKENMSRPILLYQTVTVPEWFGNLAVLFLGTVTLERQSSSQPKQPMEIKDQWETTNMWKIWLIQCHLVVLCWTRASWCLALYKHSRNLALWFFNSLLDADSWEEAQRQSLGVGYNKGRTNVCEYQSISLSVTFAISSSGFLDVLLESCFLSHCWKNFMWQMWCDSSCDWQWLRLSLKTLLGFV